MQQPNQPRAPMSMPRAPMAPRGTPSSHLGVRPPGMNGPSPGVRGPPVSMKSQSNGFVPGPRAQNVRGTPMPGFRGPPGSAPNKAPQPIPGRGPPGQMARGPSPAQNAPMIRGAAPPGSAVPMRPPINAPRGPPMTAQSAPRGGVPMNSSNAPRPPGQPPATTGGWRPIRPQAPMSTSGQPPPSSSSGAFAPPMQRGPPSHAGAPMMNDGRRPSGPPTGPYQQNGASGLGGPPPGPPAGPPAGPPSFAGAKPPMRPMQPPGQQPFSHGQQPQQPTQFEGQQHPNQAMIQQNLNGPQTLEPQVPQAPAVDTMADIADACDKRYMRCTAKRLPGSASASAQSRLPVGIICCPMALDVDHESPLDVVNFGSTGIVRCKKCRAYINPYVSWVNNGRQWRCNVCGFTNEVPNSYFCQLDPETGRRRDVYQRPELLKGSVELSAPGEYMVRPPQPPVYVFCIDVSPTAVSTGLVDVVAESILSSLDNLPGAPRTLVAVITYDATAVHFYNLKANLTTPQMFSVPDISDLFVPLPDDLLVNLNESKDVIETLLRALPKMHSANSNGGGGDAGVQQSMIPPGVPGAPPGPNAGPGTYPTPPPRINNNPRASAAAHGGPALGSALTAAYRVMGHIGGKLCVFVSSLPTSGEAGLKPRENPRAYGTDAERLLLRPEATNGQSPHWYEVRAVEFSRLQIGVELFCTSHQYADVATLSVLPRITAGQLYYYPSFSAQRDGKKLGTELERALTRPTGFEAVMRVRCTRGLRVSAFRGNYYIRGHDLLALPNCTPESVFALELSHDDQQPMTTEVATVQASLLYTTSSGERRIRVHTMVIPVAHNAQDVVSTADVDVICNLLAKSAVDIALKQGLDAARTKLQQKCVDIVTASRSAGGTAALPAYARGATSQRLPPHMQGQYGTGPPPSMPGAPPSSMMMSGPPSVSPGMQTQNNDGNSGLKLPKSLELLPLYTMGILKSAAFRGGAEINADERSFFLQRLDNMSPELTRYFIYPRVLPLHQFLLDPNTENILPAPLNLSTESIVSEGLYLLDNTLQLSLWVGGNINPDLLQSLFVGGDALAAGSMATELELKPLNIQEQQNSKFLAKLHKIIQHLRNDRPPYLQVDVIREGHPTKQPFFFRHFIEDPANFPGGQFTYKEFMAHIQRHS